MAEVVQDGESGYLVPRDDPQALAGALARLLADGEAAEAMGRRGRALVSERYAWSRIAALTRQVYEQALLGE
jgi:glycogen(starch) synthase